LDFEKAESDIFSNEEELLEVLDRQEEVIAQARSLCVPFDKRVMPLVKNINKKYKLKKTFFNFQNFSTKFKNYF